MPVIKNIFLKSIMDKESDPSYIKNGNTRHNENVRFGTNGGNDGVGVNIRGTLQVADLTDGNSDFKCIGAKYNESDNTIYYLLATTDGVVSKVAEYRLDDNDGSVILHDTTSILKLNKGGYITGINEIDGLLFFSEWGNNPRRINIERAKGYGLNGYTEKDIQVAVIPPHKPLTTTLIYADPLLDEKNNLEEKMLSFSYRWRYLDGEYSILAPFTPFQFEPLDFEYDYAEQSNISMVNKIKSVVLKFDIGNKRVTEIQLVFKESGSNDEWIIDDFNKEKLGWNDGLPKEYTFDDSKVHRALSSHVIRNYSNAVPLTNKAQTIINNRILYAHYKENYNLVDEAGVEIEIDYALELISVPNYTVSEESEIIPTLIPKQTAKSNRDYEVGVVYLDDPCRSTTVLKSKTNTIFVESKLNSHENYFNVILSHNPPKFAKYFRFFIKQTKKGYDQLLPTFFYEDGVYRWIKLEGADRDKIKEGDYLIVKSDTRGFKQKLVKTKVLEITQQEKNFLQPISVNDSIKEIAGLYFKIKPDGFHIDRNDYNIFNQLIFSKSNTNNGAGTVLCPNSTVGVKHFYGDGLDDLFSSGTFTGATDDKRRFSITIDSVGTPDKFSWNNGVGASGTNEDIIAGVPFLLSDGVSITFTADTGHTIGDEWNINARAGISNDSFKAWALFRVTDINVYDADKIFIGDIIRLEYDEFNDENHFFEILHTSNGNYDNIEEWFYKENIFNEIQAQAPEIGLSWIWFARGSIIQGGFFGSEFSQVGTNGSTQTTMTMIIKSQGTQNNQTAKSVFIEATSEVLSQDGQNIIVLETEPKNQPPEIYHEIGKTYDIVNGLHISDNPNISSDQDQTANNPLKVKLDWFNAWCYGNAVESYKIKDEFNRKGLDVGIRALTTQTEKYKEVIRKADITWSDVYEEENSFNGLGTFNLSLINFIKLDQEDGTIQLLHNSNGNLMVFQEDAIGLMPYNKNVIYDTKGGNFVGVSTNVLDAKSYQAYAQGRYGTRHPESFVARGNRKYVIDQQRGKLLRISTDGATPVSDNLFEHYMSLLMAANSNEFMIGGYDPKHGEYLFNVPNTSGIEELQTGADNTSTYSFKEKALGFPLVYTFQADFMLEANNECYAWKNGVMYRLNATEQRNNFFGNQYSSVLKFFVNQEFSVEKIFNNISLESTHAYLIKLKTNLTSRTIQKNFFTKIEDYFFAEIMGNTNNNSLSNSTFGLGSYAIVNGAIETTLKYPSMSIGDYIKSNSLPFTQSKIINITDTQIILEDNLNEVSSFLFYIKNQNIDGGEIRGDVLEVTLISDETEKTEIRSVNFNVTKSNIS
ncbi:MAG: hypothetical protein QM499_00915 [Flavobacteriaceae bacterium]